MILSPYSYFCVLAKEKRAKIICLDGSESQLFHSNISALRQLREHSKIPTERYHHFFKTKIEHGTLAEGLPDISPLILESVVITENFLADEQELNNKLNQYHLLPSEILLGMNGSTNLGAARNIMLWGLELKGCGRNSLAVRLDFHHSWGGMYLVEAINEYLTSNIADITTHLGAERTVAIAVLDGEEQISFNTKSTLLRKRSSPRLSQCLRHFEDDISHLNIKSLVNFSDENAVNSHIQNIVFQYFSSLLIGQMHNSLIPENTLLNGKFIDSTSLKLNCPVNAISFSLLLSVPNIQDKDINSTEDLQRLTDQSIFIENNSLKNYFEAISNTLSALELQKEDYIVDKVAIQNKTLAAIKKFFEADLKAKNGNSLFQSLSPLFLLRAKQKLIQTEKTALISLLTSQQTQIMKFKTHQKGELTLVQIEASHLVQFELPAIINEFNNHQSFDTEHFLISFSKMIELIDLSNNALFKQLNTVILSSIKLLPLRYEGSQTMINYYKFDDLKNEFDGEYLCYSIEKKKFKADLNEIIRLNKPIILYGYNGQPIKPKCFIN